MTKTPPATAIQQIRQRRERTLTTIVRDEIAGLIAGGQLKGGDRVNESEIAARLGVSRGPVREACRSLEEAGLLVSAVNQGVFVREMTLDDARQLYEVRGALSGLIGRLAAQNMDAPALGKLEKLVKSMESAAQRNDISRYYELNLQFHDALLQQADNQVLAGMYLTTVNQTHLFRRRGLVHKGSLQASNDEHRVILEALARRDPDAAARALEAHVARGWERLAEGGEQGEQDAHRDARKKA